LPGAQWIVGEPLAFCVTPTLPQGRRSTGSPADSAVAGNYGAFA